MSSAIEQRLEELEKVVKKDRVILTNAQNPNLSVSIELNASGELKFKKIVTTVSTSEMPLVTMNDN